MLLLATVIALVWANSPWADQYEQLWATEISFSWGADALSHSLLYWIDEGLMALFFLLVGLEIKRELLVGELSSRQQAVLPAVAALGGMVAPALIYLAFTAGTEGARGWGIPMATDIAFAVGILALVGSRVPGSLAVFLTALAIVDDIGAILVIAFFYTAEVDVGALLLAAMLMVSLVTLNMLGVRSVAMYLGLGLFLWLAMLQSGVHATIAGVLLALTLPASGKLAVPTFVRDSRALLDAFEEAGTPEQSPLCNEDREVLAEAVESNARGVRNPLGRVESSLRPWVIYGVVPLFALANAGLRIEGSFLDNLLEPVALGIILGLVVGKQVGIFLSSWLTLRTGAGRMGGRARTSHVYGVSWLGGIGFTVSLFIAGLAFAGSPLLDVAKGAILVGSAIAGVGGWLILRLVPPVAPEDVSLAEAFAGED